jgi:hypothetical protein
MSFNSGGYSSLNAGPKHYILLLYLWFIAIPMILSDNTKPGCAKISGIQSIILAFIFINILLL